MDDAGSAKQHHRRTLYACVALVALTLLVFWPILGHDFVEFDDDKLIRDNAAFNPVTLSGILDYWAGPYYGGAFPITYTFLGILAYFARDESGVIQPALFHAASLALHAGGVVIAFLTLQRLIRSDWPAALGAALFAVHPLQVETVAWATNINTLMYGFFSLLAIYLYVLYAQHQHDGGRQRVRLIYAAATVSFLLAMWSKPVAVTLPLVVAALDVWWIGRRPREVLFPAGAWLLLAMPVVVLTRLMLEQPEVFVPPLWARPLVALDAITFYLWKLVLPMGTSPDYGRSPRWLMDSAALYTTWLLPAAIAIVLLITRKRSAPLIACAIAFVAPLLPVLGLTPFHQQQYSTVADRYAYISILAAGAALAWLVRSRRAMTYVLACWLGVLAVWTRIEVGKWRDTETLFRTTVRRNPLSVPAHSMLGFLAARQGQADVAMAEYRAALDVDPGYAPVLFNLGNLYRDQNRFEEAVASYRAALARAPGNPKAHNNLGVALIRLNRIDEAVAEFTAAVRADPQWADARNNLARAIALQKQASAPASSQPASAPRR